MGLDERIGKGACFRGCVKIDKNRVFLKNKGMLYYHYLLEKIRPMARGNRPTNGVKRKT